MGTRLWKSAEPEMQFLPEKPSLERIHWRRRWPSWSNSSTGAFRTWGEGRRGEERRGDRKKRRGGEGERRRGEGSRGEKKRRGEERLEERGEEGRRRGERSGASFAVSKRPDVCIMPGRLNPGTMPGERPA